MAVWIRRLLIVLTLTFSVGSTKAQGSSPSPTDGSSCLRRCPGQPGEGDLGSCFCDMGCMQNKTCCIDYFQVCWGNQVPSCKGMCEVARTPDRPCDCSPTCIIEDDCCPDHSELCLMETVSDEEIEDMTESLLFWEEESLWEELDINLQEQTNVTSCENKPSLGSLLRFSSGTPRKFTTTIDNLMSLYNDFNPNTAVEESFTAAKPLEQSFLSSSIMDTRLMKAVINFLIAKKFVSKETVFQRKFYTMWFDTYQRSQNAAMDSSSGFEHVFLGELDSREGAIGFHNWLYLINEDSGRNISYNGYVKYLELNEKASVISINFKWRDNCKPQSSMFLGTTPEFEFALYTLCWFTRPNRLCPVLLGGKRFSVQTYVQVNHYGDKFVASAYPVMSGTKFASSSVFVLGAALLFFYFANN